MIRVTELLKHFGMYGDRYVDPYYLERGTYIHQTVEYYVNGTLDESELDCELALYLNQYKRFMDAAQYNILETESRLTSKALGITGQIDFIATKYNNSKHKKYLLDIKTGASEFPAYPLQTAFYTLLYPFKIQKRGCLHLCKDKWFITWHDDSNDFIVARSMINVYNYQNKKGLIPDLHNSLQNPEGDAMSPSNNKE